MASKLVFRSVGIKDERVAIVRDHEHSGQRSPPGLQRRPVADRYSADHFVVTARRVDGDDDSGPEAT